MNMPEAIRGNFVLTLVIKFLLNNLSKARTMLVAALAKAKLAAEATATQIDDLLIEVGEAVLASDKAWAIVTDWLKKIMGGDDVPVPLFGSAGAVNATSAAEAQLAEVLPQIDREKIKRFLATLLEWAGKLAPWLLPLVFSPPKAAEDTAAQG